MNPPLEISMNSRKNPLTTNQSEGAYAPKKSSLRNSIKVQARVIWALLMREIITRYGRHNVGFLWLFIEPMMFSIGITILWSFSGMSKGIIPVAGFALTGYSAIVLWRNMVGRLANTSSANQGLLYHSQVKILDLILSRAFLEAAGISISFIFLSFAFTAVGLISFPIDPLKTVLAWALLIWFAIGAGMIAAFAGETSEIFDRVWHVMMYLTLPFTGAFSMMNWLPPAVQEILLWSPMVHAVEMLREGYFGVGVNAIYSVFYLMSCNLVLTLVGLVLIRKIRRNLEES
jgi:capsular polysaccharide transport system permease protein